MPVCKSDCSELIDNESRLETTAFLFQITNDWTGNDNGICLFFSIFHFICEFYEPTKNRINGWHLPLSAPKQLKHCMKKCS